jgi:hypothetical protein
MNESIAGRIMDEVDVDLAVALSQELVRVPSVVGDETAIGETLEVRDIERATRISALTAMLALVPESR